LVHLETNRNKIFIGFENEPKKRETDPVSVRTYFFILFVDTLSVWVMPVTCTGGASQVRGAPAPPPTSTTQIVTNNFFEFQVRKVPYQIWGRQEGDQLALRRYHG